MRRRVVITHSLPCATSHFAKAQFNGMAGTANLESHLRPVRRRVKLKKRRHIWGKPPRRCKQIIPPLLRSAAMDRWLPGATCSTGVTAELWSVDSRTFGAFRPSWHRLGRRSTGPIALGRPPHFDTRPGSSGVHHTLRTNQPQTSACDPCAIVGLRWDVVRGCMVHVV